MQQIALLVLVASVLLGLLTFKIADPHPRCSSAWLSEYYGEDQSVSC
jgi:hypothetical protein